MSTETKELRAPVRHELKTWLEFYQPIEDGIKTFEIRKNDRDFRVGDSLILLEWNPYGENYTGRGTIRYITYITDWEQKPGFVVMSISPTPSPAAQ